VTGAVESAPLSPLALDTAGLARQVEIAVEAGLDQTLAEHFGRIDRDDEGMAHR
jgi:membrane protein